MSTLSESLPRLTANSQEYIKATQHEFLTLAGNGKLPLDRLALWLSQDRIYAAHAYAKFIGSLTARIPFRTEDHSTGDAEKKNQEILRVLSFCLTNIVQEVNFFKDTADAFGMDLDGWKEREGLRSLACFVRRVCG